nr:hypothetical protein [Glaciimonas sp. PCH181]
MTTRSFVPVWWNEFFAVPPDIHLVELVDSAIDFISGMIQHNALPLAALRAYRISQRFEYADNCLYVFIVVQRLVIDLRTAVRFREIDLAGLVKDGKAYRNWELLASFKVPKSWLRLCIWLANATSRL